MELLTLIFAKEIFILNRLCNPFDICFVVKKNKTKICAHTHFIYVNGMMGIFQQNKEKETVGVTTMDKKEKVSLFLQLIIILEHMENCFFLYEKGNKRKSTDTLYGMED